MDFSAGRGVGKRCEERVRETGEAVRLPGASRDFQPVSREWDNDIHNSLPDLYFPHIRLVYFWYNFYSVVQVALILVY